MSLRSSLLSLLLLPCIAGAVELAPGGDIRGTFGGLKAGEELVLRGGTYTLSTKILISNSGTAQQPIVLRAKEGEKPIIELNTNSNNIFELDGVRHIVLRGLTIRGGSQAIRFMSSSSYVTVEDCEISNTADAAISANSGGTYEGLILRRNEIHHTGATGEGMYLGCNDDACRVLNSTIESNYIHHTNGPTVTQGDGIELKEGSAGNIVRNNVIHDTGYPGILTYSARGHGGPNIIEGNVIWNSNDYGIQSAADSIIRNNIVLGSAIGLQSHQSGSPGNQQIIHNTVITDGNAIEVRNVVGTIVIANNAFYSSGGSAIRLISGDLSLVTVAGNVGAGGLFGASSGYTNGGGLAVDFVNANFNGTLPMDVFPKSGGKLIGAGSATYAAQTDFNGTARNGIADAGAYRFAAGGNPGWALAAGFKGQGTAEVLRPNPPTNVRVE